MKKKKIFKLQKSTSSLTNIPNFKFNSIQEYSEHFNKTIQRRNNKNNTPFENELYDYILKKNDKYFKSVMYDYYMVNDLFPEDIKLVPQFIPTNKKTNNAATFKIDEWADLEILVGMDNLIFKHTSASQSDEYRLNKLGLKKNLKIEVLRAIASDDIFKVKHFCILSSNKPKKQSIVNAIYDLKKLIISKFPNMPDNPIEYDYSKKGYIHHFSCKFVDHEEKVLEVKERMNKPLMTYNKEYDDERKSISVFHSESYDEEY